MKKIISDDVPWIFIPSKGRAKTAKTPKHFEKSAITMVVEPQDYASYVEAGYDKIVQLPKSNQGISYVRNFILDLALKINIRRYWMLDDDITNFIDYTSNKKGDKISGEEAIKRAELIFQSVPNLGQAAMEYSQYAWAQKKPLHIIGYCDVAVMIFPKKVEALRYKGHLGLKEDRDFTLQVLASGLMTARTAQISFACPKNGSNAGGLQEVYESHGKELSNSKKMVDEWPGLCEINIKPSGRQDVKIHWKRALNYYVNKK